MLDEEPHDPRYIHRSPAAFFVPSYLFHSSPAWSSSPASIDLSYTTWASRAIASGAPPKPKPAVPDPAWPFSSPPACPSPVNKCKHQDITRYISHAIHSFAMLGPPTQTHTYYHCYSPRTGASLPSSPRAARTKFTGLRPRTAAHCSAVAWMPTVVQAVGRGGATLNTEHPASMRVGIRSGGWPHHRSGGRPHGLCCGARSRQVRLFVVSSSQGLARTLLWGPDDTEVERAGGPSVGLCSHGLLRARAVLACTGCYGARCHEGSSFDEAAWPRPRPRRDPRRLSEPRPDSPAGWRASFRCPPPAWFVKQASE